MSSASICRSGASAFPRTTSRNCSAHDEVILTHAAKVGGAPAVASRFLHRLEAVAGEDALERREGGRRQICPLRRRDSTSPPRSSRSSSRSQSRRARRGPTKLSVTAIEDWLRDPYTIYAQHILKLDPLDPVDMPLSAADRGSAIHDALGEFTKAYANALPRRPRARAARASAKSISRR